MSNLQKLIENGGLVIVPKGAYVTKSNGETVFNDAEKEKLAKIVGVLVEALGNIKTARIPRYRTDEYINEALQQAEKMAGE